MDITRRQAILLIIAVATAIGILVAADQFIERVSPWDYDDFERWMDDLGPWGPIAYIAFFALSMVFAPIPTGPAPVAAAAAFGGVAGFFYTLIAGTIGATICFWIARRWGRPVLERFLPTKLVSEIDRIADHLGARVLFLMRLFPILGTDIVSYGAGLTPIAFTKYLVISIAGSIPALILISIIGEGLRENRNAAAIGVAIFGVLLIAPLLYFALRRRPPSALTSTAAAAATGDADGAQPPSIDGSGS